MLSFARTRCVLCFFAVACNSPEEELGFELEAIQASSEQAASAASATAFVAQDLPMPGSEAIPDSAFGPALPSKAATAEYLARQASFVALLAANKGQALGLWHDDAEKALYKEQLLGTDADKAGEGAKP